jgi:hypothetical protein
MLEYPNIYILVSAMFLLVSGVGIYYLRNIKQELVKIRKKL